LVKREVTTGGKEKNKLPQMHANELSAASRNQKTILEMR